MMDKKAKAFIVLAHSKELEKISGDSTIEVKHIDKAIKLAAESLHCAEWLMPRSNLACGIEITLAINSARESLKLLKDAKEALLEHNGRKEMQNE